MSKSIGTRFAVLGFALLLIFACRTDASATDTHSAINALEDSFASAVRAKDLDKIMSCYTKSEDLVIFDVTPPRQYTGWDAYKTDWQNFLAGCKDSPTIEIKGLQVYGGQGYAFSHSIQHMTCTTQQNTKMDLVLRVTDGYANFKGQWLIAHEHISVPVDLATGNADLQSKP